MSALRAYETTVAAVVGTAKAIADLHVPYVYGGADITGFDCSGLIQYVFWAGGLDLPRTTGEQWQVSQEIPREQASAGDLVFWFDYYGNPPYHVQLYIGDDQIIEAPSEGLTVRQVAFYDVGGPFAFARPDRLTELSMALNPAVPRGAAGDLGHRRLEPPG